MKKIYFILLILFSLQLVHSQSGWIIQTNFPNFSLDCVYFINENTGWASGVKIAYGGIVKTTNGGTNWFLQYSGYNNNYLFSIFFINTNTGWACGNTDSSVILKSSDGGYSWHNLPNYPTFTRNYSIKFLDQNTGWVVGYTLNANGIIRKTINGGVNWTSQYIGGNVLYNLQLVSQSELWACGDYGKILHTTNGGSSWQNKNPAIDPTLECVYFINSNTGWAVGDVIPTGGTILKTTNGGNNWFNQYSGYFYEYWSVYFINPSTGWIAGGASYPDTGIIIKTLDGGANWYRQYTGPNYGITSMYFINQNTGWTVDVGGNILKTTNGGNPIGIKQITGEEPTEFILSQNYPNPFNPTTNIKFSVPRTDEGQWSFIDLQLVVYDILGNEIETIVYEKLRPGKYEVEWNGSNYSSGIYVYKLSAGSYRQAKKMVLIK